MEKFNELIRSKSVRFLRVILACAFAVVVIGLSAHLGNLRWMPSPNPLAYFSTVFSVFGFFAGLGLHAEAKSRLYHSRRVPERAFEFVWTPLILIGMGATGYLICNDWTWFCTSFSLLSALTISGLAAVIGHRFVLKINQMFEVVDEPFPIALSVRNQETIDERRAS